MPKFFVRTCCALSALFFLISSAASAAENLTWEQCVLESRKNHPDLVSAREKINQASADRSIAASALFPQVNGSFDADTSRTAHSKRLESYSYGVGGSQLLFDGFKTRDEVEQAAKNIDVNRYNYEVTSSNIRLRLRTAFIDLLEAQQSLELTQRIADRRRQNRDLIRLRYESGNENKGALMTAEANLAQAEFEIEQAKRSIGLARRNLSKELGRGGSSDLAVTGSFDVSQKFSEKPDFQKMSVSTPFLRVLALQKEAARWGVESAKASFFPSVFANGFLGRSASQWPPRDNEFSAGATVSMPFFEGGSLVAGESKARAFYRQTEADEKSGLDGIALTLENTWAQLEDAVGFVEVEQKVLEANQTRSKIAEAEYSTGLVNFNDWTIIEDNLVNTEKAYLNAQANAVLAEAGWLQAKGETLDEE